MDAPPFLFCDEILRSVTIASVQTSNLIKTMLPAISQAGRSGPVLDLACGSGRNGIYLVKQGQPVVFADRRQAVLDDIAQELEGNELASYWAVDLEQPECNPLAKNSFAAILAFRYLHRPLFASLKASVQPGGLVVYETFTTSQPRFGRPSNPDFLLRPGELEDTFSNWNILHSFEGVTRSETGGRDQAIAQIVARKKIPHPHRE
jgi:tellurite methyltransferase